MAPELDQARRARVERAVEHLRVELSGVFAARELGDLERLDRHGDADALELVLKVHGDLLAHPARGRRDDRERERLGALVADVVGAQPPALAVEQARGRGRVERKLPDIAVRDPHHRAHGADGHVAVGAEDRLHDRGAVHRHRERAPHVAVGEHRAGAVEEQPGQERRGVGHERDVA